MKRLCLLFLLALLAGCVSDANPTPRTQPSEKAVVPGAEPEEGNFTLYISNQSFERRTVEITVSIDGKRIARQQFEVKNQHNWIPFVFDLPAGAHELRAVSTTGAAKLTARFNTTARHWGVVDYWCCGEPDDPKFTFNLSDQPIGFA